MSCFAKKKLPVKSHRLLTDRQPDTRACIHMHTLTDAHAHTCKQTSTKSCQCIHVSAALLCIHSANVSSDVTKAHCVYVALCTQIDHVECVCQHAYKVHTSVDAKIQLTLPFVRIAFLFQICSVAGVGAEACAREQQPLRHGQAAVLGPEKGRDDSH